MSTITPTLSQSTVTTPAHRADVTVKYQITIPGWINTLAEYRRWAESDRYPRSGWVSYLNGVIFVDQSMEEFLTHNRVKQAFNTLFGMLLMHEPPGCFVPDRMLLANEAANLSTEPDGLFYLWATMQSGRLRLIPGEKSGNVQLEGTPDCVLEVVGDGSVKKDLEVLRDLYWKAQIPEYWLVDARKDDIRFEILRHGKDGYEPTNLNDGWLHSDILGRSFRMERTLDPLGLPQFTVHARP